LYDQICNLEQWNEKQAAELIRQLISSVCYCHDKNIAHRDIKPENILLEKSTKEGKAFDIKLVDFGMAKYFDKLKKYQEKLGSPLYMAPEIVRGESYDMKCDIWSLGIILYILLSGSVPFKKTGNQAALFNEIKLCEFTMADLQGTPSYIVNL
jgi:calcium-dependent protein kinase